MHWLPLGVAIVVVVCFSYVAVQQNYRMSLNDPQIQMAEDGAAALAAGKSPAEIVPRAELFDIGQSLAPFIAVYDKDGTPLEASAKIGNYPPKPPAGVFAYAMHYGEDRVTWQPDANTRIALIVKRVDGSSGYFVGAGRNMREVEAREDALAKLFLIALFTGLFFSFTLDFLGDVRRRRVSKK